jgi:hypothetical protein
MWPHHSSRAAVAHCGDIRVTSAAIGETMRQSPLIVVNATLIALLILGLRAHGVETQVPQATFRSRTDLVPVDVSVLDRDRRPVPGLTPEDFKLFVDGKSSTHRRIL